MARKKNTARKRTDRRAPRRPIAKAKPYPKDKFILKWLYYAIEHEDETLLDLILTFPRFGRANLLNAIDLTFDNLSLSGEILDFFDWKWKTNSLEQDHEHVGTYSKSGFDDTFGHGTPLLFYALEKDDTKLLKKMVQFAPGIDVHKPVRYNRGGNWSKKIYPYECADDDLEKQMALFGKQGFYYAFSENDSDSRISLLFENKDIDYIYVVKTCLMQRDMKTIRHILQMVPEPALSWIKQNGLQFILRYCKGQHCDGISALDEFEELVQSYDIDLTPCNPSKNFDILTSIFVSDLASSEKIEQLKYLFSKGFEITPEVGTFATELRYLMSRELFEFIQSKLSICPGPPLKKRKLC